MKTITKILSIAMISCGLTTAAQAAQTINFVPKPVSVEYTGGSLTLDKNLMIAGGDQWNVNYLKKHLDAVFDFDVKIYGQQNRKKGIQTLEFHHGMIEFVKNNELPEEAYGIEVSPESVIISSSSRSGEFYAIQTLLQMFPAGIYRPVSNKEDGLMLKTVSLPCIRVCDAPRFSYRGNMLDVSRTFFSKEYVLRHLDFLAYHKINKFHWHLVDDNGWRIEIKKYPKLTQVGAWRGKNCALPPAYNSGPDAYGGFYTQEDIKEIVKYASERNIEVIPEIDLPGHSKGIAASYLEILCHHDLELQSVQGEVKNVFCVGREENYKMLENIFKEIAALFPSQYINIGGDEVATENWKYCAECQAIMKKMGYTDEGQLLGYFVERLDKIIHKLGKKMGGWHDIVVADNIEKDALVVAWKSRNAMDAINKGFQTVMQPGEYCYIDMKYSPRERGHQWAAIVSMEKIYSFDPTGTFPMTEEQKKLVVGPAAGLWTEMLFFPPHFSEYQMFPRLCALSEIGWTPQEQRDYKEFDARLEASHFARLYNMGIKFRIPYPEIKVLKSKIDGDGNMTYALLTAKSPYANMVVRYTTDGSEPTLSSPVLTGEIIAENPKNLRFATFFCDVKSITLEVPDCHNYLTPITKVSTSFEVNKRFPLENLEKYDFKKYFRSASLPKEGDYVLYSFEQPVECAKITVQTNDPVNHFFGVTEAHVEYSFDGVNFVNAGDFDMYNKVVIENPEKAVKAVKIVVDGEGEQKQVSIQCLKIER